MTIHQWDSNIEGDIQQEFESILFTSRGYRGKFNRPEFWNIRATCNKRLSLISTSCKLGHGHNWENPFHDICLVYYRVKGESQRNTISKPPDLSLSAIQLLAVLFDSLLYLLTMTFNGSIGVRTALPNCDSFVGLFLLEVALRCRMVRQVTVVYRGSLPGRFRVTSTRKGGLSATVPRSAGRNMVKVSIYPVLEPFSAPSSDILRFSWKSGSKNLRALFDTRNSRYTGTTRYVLSICNGLDRSLPPTSNHKCRWEGKI